MTVRSPATFHVIRSTPFTAIQIRDNYPGSPPIGIAADFAVVVPALVGSVAVAAVLLHEWLNRQDFDTTGSKGNIE